MYELNRGRIMQFQTHQEAKSLTDKYRRNGKLQSCEPCRKSKLRCDHVLPVCGRCVSRRRESDCVYHPNPLTQTGRTQSKAQRRARSVTTSIQQQTPPTTTSSTHSSPVTVLQTIEQPALPEPQLRPSAVLPLTSGALQPTFSVAAEPVVHAQRAASAPPLDAWREPVSRVNLGFLGATSYSSILSEELRNLGAGAVDLQAEAQPPQLRRQNLAISNHRIAQGCRVLAFLRDRSLVSTLVFRGYEMNANTMCPEFIMREWLHQLWACYGDVLVSQDPVRMRRLCEMLWRNTQSPPVFDSSTTALEWARLSTGANLRWEVIGLVATSVGLSVNSRDGSALYDPDVSRSALTTRMVEAAGACLDFSRGCGVIDDVFTWLLAEYAILSRGVAGDSSYESYRISGELNNAVVVLGLHQQEEPARTTGVIGECIPAASAGNSGRGVLAGNSSHISGGKRPLPLFLTELRKRMFLATYSMEISLATFLGRPPRLSYRHCTLPQLLDLTDNQLTLKGAELEGALSELDDQGYNKRGQMRPWTSHKAWQALAVQREDILDLALGRYTREEVLQRVAAIREATELHWARLPEFIRRLRSDDVDLSRIKPVEVLDRTVLRQGLRSNDLLLERVLISKTGARPERLVRLARAIFRDILFIVQRHDMACMFDLGWILAVHGLRTGAIIAVELLRQELRPALHPEDHEPLLPRSQTIQDLSVFAAHLAAVDPESGIFAMCEQARKVITCILDKILAPGAVSRQAPHCNGGQPGRQQRRQQRCRQHEEQQEQRWQEQLQDQHQHPQLMLQQQQQQQQQQQLRNPQQEEQLHVSPNMILTPDGPEVDMPVLSAPISELLDFGMGMEAPLNLGNDNDFVQWLGSMDWERNGTWSGF